MDDTSIFTSMFWPISLPDISPPNLDNSSVNGKKGNLKDTENKKPSNQEGSWVVIFSYPNITIFYFSCYDWYVNELKGWFYEVW